MPLKINNTQLNHWKTKLSTITGRFGDRYSKHFQTVVYPPIPSMTQEEKVAQILNGRAEMRELDADACISMKFIQGFIFEGEGAIIAEQKFRERKIVKAVERMHKEAADIIDNFILERFETQEEILACINTFYDRWNQEMPLRGVGSNFGTNS